MSEAELPQRQIDAAGWLRRKGFLLRQLPYIVVLVLAIAGVAYTNISHQPLVGYWEFLTLAMAVVCVVTEWAKVGDRHARWQLILKRLSRRPQSFITPNLLSGCRDGCRRPRDRLA